MSLEVHYCIDLESSKWFEEFCGANDELQEVVHALARSYEEIEKLLRVVASPYEIPPLHLLRNLQTVRRNL